MEKTIELIFIKSYHGLAKNTVYVTYDLNEAISLLERGLVKLKSIRSGINGFD